MQEHKIDTGEQLAGYTDTLETRISGLVSRRKDLYRQKRRGEDVETDIQSINEELRPLRCNLRLCQQIQEDIPVIREQLSLCVEKPAEKSNTKIKQRKRGHELWM